MHQTIDTKTKLFKHVVEKVHCPSCNARPGQRCVSGSGRPTDPHLQRHAIHIDTCKE